MRRILVLELFLIIYGVIGIAIGSFKPSFWVNFLFGLSIMIGGPLCLYLQGED